MHWIHFIAKFVGVNYCIWSWAKTITGLEACIHIWAQRFILFGVVNGARRLFFISYIKNIHLISLGHCCVYLPITDNFILFLLSIELTFLGMFQEFKQFTPRILSFSALSCRQSTELINIRRSQCLSIMHIYIYILVMKPVCAHVKPNVFINEYKKIGRPLI